MTYQCVKHISQFFDTIIFTVPGNFCFFFVNHRDRTWFILQNYCFGTETNWVLSPERVQTVTQDQTPAGSALRGKRKAVRAESSRSSSRERNDWELMVQKPKLVSRKQRGSWIKLWSWSIRVILVLTSLFNFSKPVLKLKWGLGNINYAQMFEFLVGETICFWWS